MSNRTPVEREISVLEQMDDDFKSTRNAFIYAIVCQQIPNILAGFGALKDREEVLYNQEVVSPGDPDKRELFLVRELSLERALNARELKTIKLFAIGMLGTQIEITAKQKSLKIRFPSILK